MSHYRRANKDGCSHFFTVVSYRRQQILCDAYIRKSLRAAIIASQLKHPFTIDAWILLPDHLHCIWTLPRGDADFSKRWSIIKRSVSLDCAEHYKKDKWVTASKKKHRESTIWQRRFWEHRIRDQNDFNRHIDYIHYNPVKHGLCKRPVEWQYSTLHRYIRDGIYPVEWAAQGSNIDSGVYGE
jgi:putative transposase